MGAGETASGMNLERFPELGSQGQVSSRDAEKVGKREGEDRARGNLGKYKDLIPCLFREKYMFQFLWEVMRKTRGALAGLAQ